MLSTSQLVRADVDERDAGRPLETTSTCSVLLSLSSTANESLPPAADDERSNQTGSSKVKSHHLQLRWVDSRTLMKPDYSGVRETMLSWWDRRAQLIKREDIINLPSL
jgi:hypothetical protein